MLGDNSALDFDDLLLRTVELFEKAERVRHRYAARFRFIQVDEYQDTNRPQYLLIRQLADEHRNICVVGDPDQSIYSGAAPTSGTSSTSSTTSRRRARSGSRQNYRSTQVILDAATAVIRQNRNRKEKRLWTDRAGGRPHRHVPRRDEIEEADFITRVVREAVGGRRRDGRRALPHERAVARDRGRAPARGVPYKVIGSVRFYERKKSRTPSPTSA